VHTEVVGPPLSEMRWDNCLSVFLFDQEYNGKSIIV